MGTIQKLKTFMTFSGHMKFLCLEAFSFQLIVGLLLKLIPFRWIPRLFRNPISKPVSSSPSPSVSPFPGPSVSQSFVLRSSAKGEPHPSSTVAQRRRASRLTPSQIKTAIQSTSPISPWRNKCLVQSLAARWMLKRRRMNSELSLGVTYDKNRKMIAHAWLKTGDFEIVERNGDYVEMYLF